MDGLWTLSYLWIEKIPEGNSPKVLHSNRPTPSSKLKQLKTTRNFNYTMKHFTLLSVAVLLVLASVAKADIPCKDYCKSLLGPEICDGLDNAELEECELDFMQQCIKTCDTVTNKYSVCEMENVFIPTRGKNLLTCTCGTGTVTFCLKRCPVSVLQRAFCATGCVLRGQGRPTAFTCVQNSPSC